MAPITGGHEEKNQEGGGGEKKRKDISLLELTRYIVEKDGGREGGGQSSLTNLFRILFHCPPFPVLQHSALVAQYFIFSRFC